MWTSSWACEQHMQQHDALSTHMPVSSSDRSAQDGWCTTADMQPKGSIKPHAMPYTAPSVAAARCVTWTPCTPGRMCHRHAKEGRSTLMHQHTIKQPARHLQHTARLPQPSVTLLLQPGGSIAKADSRKAAGQLGGSYAVGVVLCKCTQPT
jgi:hypothetical protein